MEPGISAIFEPVMHDSVGKLKLLHGILEVAVRVPHTLAAWLFLMGMIFMDSPLVRLGMVKPKAMELLTWMQWLANHGEQT